MKKQSSPSDKEFQRHFRKSDLVIHATIRAVGPFTLRPQRNRFGMLVRSIVGQQLSMKAARTIHDRLVALVAPDPISPESIVRLRKSQLRGVGLSLGKAEFVRDLASKVASKEVDLSRIGRKADEEIIAELTQIRGVGRWTAQMFLIFSLGRLDVFPFDDLGVRAAMRNLYGLSDLPDKQTAHEIAAAWSPYSSVASWYCWRSLEQKAPPLPPSKKDCKSGLMGER